jgi:peptide/nickel transport system substrate-binding protein
MKRSLILVFAVLALCGQNAFAGGSAAPSGTPLKVVNVGVTNDPGSLNPLGVYSLMRVEASRVLFMPLSAVNTEKGFTNRLAESITTEDNLTFTVKVNQKVKWTDGKPVTADDVIFTINSIANPAVGVLDPTTYNVLEGTEESGLYPAGAGGISGVTKVDDYTVAFKTKYPITLNIFNLIVGAELQPIPKHILEKEPPENLIKSSFWQNPKVSNGPFIYKEFVPSQYISYEANDTYFLGRPKIDMLNFKILSGTQITAQLESGEVDLNWPGVGFFPVDDYERIQSFSHLTTQRGIPAAAQILFYNNAVLNNVKVRQALDLSIDRDAILQNIFKGVGNMTKTPVTNQIEYWNEPASRYEYNVEKAKRLLAESGWDLSKRLVFLVPTGNVTRERICTMVAEYFKAIGLNVEIEKADFPTTFARIQRCEYDISIAGIPDMPLNIIRYLRLYAGSKNATWTNYVNPRADALIDTIQTSVDPAVLKDAYYALQDLMAEEVPLSGLYCELALRAKNKRLIYGDLQELGSALDFEKWDVQL